MIVFKEHQGKGQVAENPTPPSCQTVAPDIGILLQKLHDGRNVGEDAHTVPKQKHDSEHLDIQRVVHGSTFLLVGWNHCAEENSFREFAFSYQKKPSCLLGLLKEIFANTS